MSTLSWITPTGSIANLPLGVESFVAIQAGEYPNYGATITYQIINGSMPPGLTFNSDGTITGAATNPGSADVAGNNISNFIVRAKSSDGLVLDGSFSITISNINMSSFEWVTPSGNLGTVPVAEFYSLQLGAVDTTPGATITYTLVSGDIPGGMRLTYSGLFQGVPTILSSIAVDQTETYRFTVRATSSAGRVVDQAFNITITNVIGPTIEPTSSSPSAPYLLGTFFDGELFSQQLLVSEPNPNVTIQWSVVGGTLPPGITLSSTGLLYGYLSPIQLVGTSGPEGYDGDTTTVSGIITDQQEYDGTPYDYINVSASISYSFTVQAYDGANYDLQKYSINVVGRSGLTADSTDNTVNDTFITLDSGNYYVPMLLDPSTTLPAGRQNSYYAYKFQGYDPQGYALTYSLVNQAGTFDAGVPGVDNGFDYNGDDVYHLSGVGFDSIGLINTSVTNLPGLVLDSSTGWLYGKIDSQEAALSNFTLTLQVNKTITGQNAQTLTSPPVIFTLPVKGDVNNTIQWISPKNLGYITNGAVSDLSVKAINTEGRSLTYSLIDKANFPCRLPQGLSLDSSGNIIGRVTFESFTLDHAETTFDGGSLTIDRTYNFYVEVSTTDGTISSIQEFSIIMSVTDKEPYNNLYIKAMPAFDQRQIYTSIIKDTNIFAPSLIYRYGDPWFGIQSDMQMLFMAGLTTQELDLYQAAIANNHWIKTYNFGEIKTATVLDNNYNVKYEVVYVEVLDPEENSAGNGPPLEVSLTKITHPYIDKNGNTFNTIYPNTTQNMIDRLAAGVGYSDRSTLPEWMTSNQPGTGGSAFNPPLGYTKAVVLAYTVEGASKLIAYRLKNSGINFSNMQFTVDRYEVDNYYSTNFNYTTRTFITGTETTFDHGFKTVGDIVATVTYAITGVPFDQINGRPVNYVVSSGGLDGITTFKTGDTLIFAQQELFSVNEPYDGWGSYVDAYIGDNVKTGVNAGYDSEAYDEYSITPGFLEHTQNPSLQNQRGGIWTVNIINNTVNLVFTQSIDVNSRVNIVRGNTYGGAVMYYGPPNGVTTPPGYTGLPTVPYYSVYKITPQNLNPATTFNSNTTRFFSYKDQYYVPGTQDKYLRFPQDGAFN
jgi:hypothetical protein